MRFKSPANPEVPLFCLKISRLRTPLLASVLSCSLFAALFTSSAMAQQFKVEKVKGNKAVIEFSGTELSAGRNYSIGGTSASAVSSASTDRKYVLGGSLDLQFFDYTSSSLAGTTSKKNLIQILSRFGWNLERYEVGFIAGYSNSESASTVNSSVQGGGFFDFNLTPNRPGENSIYGASGEATYTSITSSVGGTSIGVYGSGFAKWFVLGPSTAIRLDGGYRYDKGTNTSYNTTTQGFAIRGGLSTYF